MNNQFTKNFMNQLLSNDASQGNVLDPNLTADQLEDQSNAPLFVQPSELQSAEMADVNTPSPVLPTRSAPMVEDSIAPQVPMDESIIAPEAPKLSPQEELLKQYEALSKSANQKAEENERGNKYAKIAGVIGEGLGRYQTAGLQKNVLRPIDYNGPTQKAVEPFINENPQSLKNLAEQKALILAKYNELKKAGTAKEIADAKFERDKELAQLKANNADERFEKGLGLRERALELRAGDLAEKAKDRDRVSDKQAGELSGFDETMQAIERTKGLKEKIDTGPVASFRNTIAGVVGRDDPNVTALRTQTLDTLAERIKQLSGTASSEKESERLRITLPSMTDNDEVFNRKLADVEKRINEARDIRLQSFQKQGKNTDEFSKISKPQGQNQSNDRVDVVSPDGKPGKIPKSQVDAALAQGYKLR